MSINDERGSRSLSDIAVDDDLAQQHRQQRLRRIVGGTLLGAVLVLLCAGVRAATHSNEPAPAPISLLPSATTAVPLAASKPAKAEELAPAPSVKSAVVNTSLRSPATKSNSSRKHRKPKN